MVIFLSQFINLIIFSVLYIAVSLIIPILMNYFLYDSGHNNSRDWDVFPTLFIFLAKLVVCIAVPSVAIYYVRNNVVAFATSVGATWMIYKFSDLFLFGHLSIYI